MYTIFADDLCIYDDLNNRDAYRLINPVWHREENTGGSLTFSMPVCNIGYDKVERLKSHIYIYKKGVEVWEGRVISEKVNFNKDRDMTCEGALGYLNDVIQPQRELINPTPRTFLQTILQYHNEKTSEDRHFTLGEVTVTHPMIDESGEDEYDDDVYIYTNYTSTFDCIKEKLIDKNTDKYNDKKKELKGYIRIRKENGVRYLDYLKDYPRRSNQVIDFGVNLLDFAIDYDESEYCTVLIPLGERLPESTIEGLEGYLDICPINDGKNYIENTTAIAAFGRIEHVEHFDDIFEEEELLEKGQQYLADVQFGKMQLSVTAVDLSHLNVNADEIELLDEIRVRSLPHGLDRWFPVTEIDMNLDSPASTNYTLGLKDVLSNSGMSYYANAIEVTNRENYNDNKIQIQEAKDEIDQVATDVDVFKSQTEVNFDILDDGLAAEVRRATSKETEIYSKVTMTAEEIAAEVTRSMGAEGELSSRISITAEQIASEVTQRTASEQLLRSSIVQNATSISMKVENGSVSSSLMMESNQMTFHSGRIIIDGGNFTLDAEGNATATNFKAKEQFELYSDSSVEASNSHVFLEAVNGAELALLSTKDGWNSNPQHFADLDCRTVNCRDMISERSIYSQNDLEAEDDVIANGSLVSRGAESASSSANVFITGQGYLRQTTSSSQRWKNSIMTDLGPELDPHKLYNLDVVQFRYNTDYLSDALDSRFNTPVIGFIAENVDEIYPIACDYDKYHLPADWNHRYIIPPMLKLIQEQHEEIESLKHRVAVLEGGNE